MFVHALSGAASFAACLRLFRSYPLAVTPSPADGWRPSIVLRHRAFDGSGYYVLAQQPGDRFTLRPWCPDEGEAFSISAGAPVAAIAHRIVAEGMPVPKDGALLGWISDRQATVLLSVFHGDPVSQGPASRFPVAPGAATRVPVPQVRVLALVGSEPMRWPPFTASPLDDGRLWEYVERGEIVDLAPLLAGSGGGACWVPSQHPGRAGQGHGCVVVNRNLQAEEYWVPSGIYMDHWMLREGVPTPPASHLLTLPGTTDLSCRLAS